MLTLWPVPVTFPLKTLFGLLSPGFRSRKPIPTPLEVQQPATAKLLLALQRDPSVRFAMGPAGEAALAVEYGTEGHLLVHYVSPPEQTLRKHLSIAGGWLGAGRRRYLWLPLRTSLLWNAPSGPNLTPEDISCIASDLHAGLDLMGERHVLEEFHEPKPIPLEERRAVLDQYSAFMALHGWTVTCDDDFTRRSLKRTDSADSPQNWSIADREALTRMEALVSETLKGVRSSSRILYETK